MRITCSNCRTQYSIAESKEVGKTLKLRCKQCGERIIIQKEDTRKNKPQSNPEKVAHKESAASDAIWHVIINDRPRGPYLFEQVVEMITTNQINAETFVWREDFTDWTAAGRVNELSDAITNSVSRRQSVDTTAGIAASRKFTKRQLDVNTLSSVTPATTNGTISMGADPFAEESDSEGSFSKGKANSLNSSADVSRSKFDLGSLAKSRDRSDKAGIKSSAQARASAVRQSATGSRNENSVLFSLNNLQKFAAAPQSSADFSDSDMKAPQRGAGLASGDGSGFIDIRALAIEANEQQARDREPTGSKEPSVSSGYVIGGLASLGSPLSSSTTARRRARDRSIVFAIIGAIGFLALSGFAVPFIIDMGQRPGKASAAAVVAPGIEAEPIKRSNQTKSGEKKDKTDKQTTSSNRADSSNVNTSMKTHANRERRKRHDKTRVRRSNALRSRTKPVEREASSVEKEPEPKKKRTTGNKSIDELIDLAVGDKTMTLGKKKTRRKQKPASRLPERPSRDDVLRTLRKVQPKLKACARGQRGVAMADIVVAGSGRVRSVRVTQVTGPTASCVAREVRKARFPKFSSSKFSVKFPFRL